MPVLGFSVFSPTLAPSLYRRYRLSFLHVMPFISIHVACFASLFIEFHWTYLLLALGLYYARMFFVTAGYHRYFSHRSFKTSRSAQFALAFLAMTSAQKGVLWWAAHHRNHHRLSDTEDDLHSPTQQGFWWAHVGWVLSRRNDETHVDMVRDYYKYPELRWLNQHFLVPPFVLAVVLFLVGGWGWLIWGFFISTVMLWHGSFMVNSLAHLFGKRRYQTKDTSRNSFLLSLITMGEGWHNNHHHYMASVRQGFYWWELDMTFYLLRSLSWFGIVWDLRYPSESIMNAARAS